MNKIIETIKMHAVESPELICYQDDEKSYTFAELNQDSEKLANLLLEKKNTVNDGPVLIYGSMSYEMVVSFIACMKSGRAYAPIESTTPADRVSLIAEVSEYSMILAFEEWPIVDKKGLISMEAISNCFAQKLSTQVKPVNYVTGKEIVYMIFTSGTTGVPKGVQITYDNLDNFLGWCVTDFGYQKGDNFLSQVPYSFDVSIMVTYTSLMVGGILHPIRKELVGDFNKLHSALVKCKLSVWISTPSFVEICLLNPEFNGESLPYLKSFVLAGEELKRTTAAALIERFPNAKVNNAYGPTEATVIVTKIEITEDILNEFDRLPIGYIKPGTDLFTVDADNNRLDDGEVGELIICGPTVSPGYVNNHEKTAEVFFDYKGTPAYRTGDAAYIKNGIVNYQGRMDFQVKLHGYRIELEDVEHHLRKTTFVKMATVVPKYKEHKVQQLVAFIVAKENDFEKNYQLAKAIKEEMKASVMSYMIPQKIVFVDELPLTQNGKVDRKALHSEVHQK